MDGSGGAGLGLRRWKKIDLGGAGLVGDGIAAPVSGL